MGGERGQATVEWAGLALLVAVVLVVGGSLIHPPPFAQRITCAILAGCRGEAAALEAAYGSDVGATMRAFAPNLVYASEMLTLPIDFRHCRSHRCSDGPDSKASDVWRSDRGEQATVFTHAVDQREKGGYLFLQYWLYYPDSTYSGTAYAISKVGGDLLAITPAGLIINALSGHHEDDWESYQVRIDGQGRAWSRASAHHGYAGHPKWPNLHELGFEPTLPDFERGGFRKRLRTGAWTPITGWTRITRGSHAGHIVDGPQQERRTESNGVNLVPIESLSKDARGSDFSITPPWRKRVYSEPDRNDT